MEIRTAKPTDSPSLYIQCKGLHSGRPLKKYIPNSFSVYTDDPLAFSKCFVLWKSNLYKVELKGSVVPFIRIRDVRRILEHGFKMLDHSDVKHLELVNQIDTLVSTKAKEIDHLKTLQVQLARSLLNG